MSIKSWQWRISSSEAGLAFGQFAAIDIPIPDLFDYRPNSLAATVGDGSQRMYGYTKAILFWDSLSQRHYRHIRQFTDQQKSPIFMTIDRENGSKSSPYFIDISGFPHIPLEIQRLNSLVARTGPNIFSNIQVQLVNVAIINDPSNYTVL